MAILTVHNLDNKIKKQLEINAINNNCSVEEEVQKILKQALFPIEQQKMGSYLHKKIMELTGGEAFDLPAHSLPRSAHDFSDNAQ